MKYSFPKAEMIELPDLRMAIYQMGKEDQPAIILCHGFPEIAFSWRHQIEPLALAGFRVIAPDMRGYGQTGLPKGAKGDESDIPLYDMEHLTSDLVALCDALNIEKAIFCGHDWGGIVVWQMPLLHPDRVLAIIGVNTPFMPRPPLDPISGLRHVYGDDNYIVSFQDYGVADEILNQDIARSQRFWYRKGLTRAQYDSMPKDRKNHSFIKALQASSSYEGQSLLNDEEMAVYVKAFRQTGFTPPINWYRNLTRNWQMSEGQKQHITHPCLMISAADDVVLTPEMADGMENYIDDLEKQIIPDCGHWTQSEQPDALNRIMIDWLTRKCL